VYVLAVSTILISAHMQVALSDTGIPKANVSSSAVSDDEPEVDVSDEEFLQFDTSSAPVIITLTKVTCFFPYNFFLCWRNMLYRFPLISTVWYPYICMKVQMLGCQLGFIMEKLSGRHYLVCFTVEHFCLNNG
jgi:hypothetical protein